MPVAKEILCGLLLVVLFVDIVVLLVGECVSDEGPDPVENPVDGPEDSADPHQLVAEARQEVELSVERHCSRCEQTEEPAADPQASADECQYCPQIKPLAADGIVVHGEPTEKISCPRMLVRPLVMFVEELLPIWNGETLIKCHTLRIRETANQANVSVVLVLALCALVVFTHKLTPPKII